MHQNASSWEAYWESHIGNAKGTDISYKIELLLLLDETPYYQILISNASKARLFMNKKKNQFT